MDAIHSSLILPLLVAAENHSNGVVEFGWRELINYGALGIWVVFMIYRDYRESTKQDKRHEENLAASKRIEDAFRTNTESIIIGISGMQTLDDNYKKLLSTVRQHNKPE